MVWEFQHPNGDRKSCPKLPPDLPASIPTYRFFAKTYGWPPEVVNELPNDVAEWLPIMEHAASEADDTIQEIIRARNGN